MTLRVLISAALLLAQQQSRCAVRGLHLRLSSENKGAFAVFPEQEPCSGGKASENGKASKPCATLVTANADSAHTNTMPVAEAVPTVLGSVVECTALAPPVQAMFVGIPVANGNAQEQAVGGDGQSDDGKEKNANTTDDGNNVPSKTTTRRRRCCCRRKRSHKEEGKVSPVAQAEKYTKGDAENAAEKGPAQVQRRTGAENPAQVQRTPPKCCRHCLSDDPMIVAWRRLMLEVFQYILWIAYTAVGARIVDVYDPSLCAGGAGGGLRNAVTGQLVSHALLFFHHLARVQELRVNPSDVHTGEVTRVEPLRCCSFYGLAAVGIHIWTVYELIILAPSSEHACSAVREGLLWDFGLASIIIPAVLLCFKEM